MDIILGEEIIRIADDEPRYINRTGNGLGNQRLSDLLHISRHLIVINSPDDLWEEKGRKAVRNLDEEVSEYS